VTYVYLAQDFSFAPLPSTSPQDRKLTVAIDGSVIYFAKVKKGIYKGNELNLCGIASAVVSICSSPEAMLQWNAKCGLYNSNKL
jgi:hypothetical protein